jgi:protein-tyrosine sulfotransferase
VDAAGTLKARRLRLKDFAREVNFKMEKKRNPIVPIFILGISQRSGTNYLVNLLLKHPGCCRPMEPIREDSLLKRSNELIKYVKSLCLGWKKWGDVKKIESELFMQLGRTLVSYIQSQNPKKRLVTKTPSVENLPYFTILFPDACLIVLVRDGRDVVESRIKTFGECFETAIRKWVDGADVILKNQHMSYLLPSRFILVRYEELWCNTENVLRKIFKKFELDPTLYNFETAVNIPVVGSSVFHGKEKKIHWKPVARTKEFNPINRWGNWDIKKHSRFNWLAGEQMLKLGYHIHSESSDSFLSIIINKYLDAKWELATRYKIIKKSLSNIIKGVIGEKYVKKYKSKIKQILR